MQRKNQQRMLQQRTILVFSILLVLLFMQFSAMSHAAEHPLNTTELSCITHLEAEQFSNLLIVKGFEIIDNHNTLILHLHNKNFTINGSTQNYQSRAPPAFFQ